MNGEFIFRSKPWRITVSYGFGKFDNSGFQENINIQSVGNVDDTETGDSDYQEDLYGASLEYSHKLYTKRFRTKLQLSVADRHYQTARLPEFDPIHHARRDVVVTSTIRSSVSLSKKVDFKIGLSNINRDSDASDSVVERVKSYTRFVGWVEVSYDL